MASFLVRLQHLFASLFVAFLLLTSAAATVAVGPRGAAAQGILFVRVGGEKGPIVNATVEVAQRDTVWRRLDTDTRGAARFAAMLPGTYEVRVQAYGYRPHVEQNVSVSDASTVLDLFLESSAVPLEGLTVTSERVQIERENTEFNTRVDKKAIELLPATHDARDIVALVPGARPGHVWGGSNFQADNYRIDGLSNNNPGMGGDLIKPNLNWIDHVEVRGLGAGAEDGGFQGGLIDVVTKRGTNDFHGMVRTSLENHALNATNLVSTEIGSEVSGRRELEGEAQGSLVRDRLFYYVSAKDIRQELRALNHLTEIAGTYAPRQEKRTEDKLFGKLTWTPRPATEVNVSAAYLGTTADNWDQTGYESPGAAHRYRAPTWLFNASWRETLGIHGVLEARVNHISLDERMDAYGGTGVPGVRLFSLIPPYTSFQNNPFTLRDAPSGTSASVSGSFQVKTGDLQHLLKAGVEYNRGSFHNERTRNGGMTWLPTPVADFDPSAPSTWTDPNAGWTATQWGGEVHLNADVANAAAYVQSSISLSSRVVLSPGVRWSRWQGWITPLTGSRFQAVTDQALDPRVGLTVDLVPDGSWTAKAHWGRYHQDMVTQMFDRAAGSDAFTNEEVWYYHGAPVTDASTVFKLAQRDSLAALGLFTREAVESLNETGRVEGYKQPYLEEWLVGVEKRFGHSAKLSILYTRRSNHDMVALVDRNIATNYTRFGGFRAGGYGTSEPEVIIPGDTVSQHYPGTNGISVGTVYLPNNVLLERLRCRARGTCPYLVDVPGLTYADTANLSWNPDYVVTTAPGAHREFGQFQMVVNVSRPTWGGSFSVVKTLLKGNLDNVTGYTDPTTYDPGPYVRINESLNDYGYLENYAGVEAKVSVWGNLPAAMQGGLFWTYRSGDRYSSVFRLTTLGHYTYSTAHLEADPINQWRRNLVVEPLDTRFFAALEGDYMFQGTRGKNQLPARANLDAHLERSFEVAGREVAVSLDVFNVLGYKDVTQVQEIVNYGTNPWGVGMVHIAQNAYFGSPLERVPPRTLRLSTRVDF
ncbi:MAG: carboxypeptidase regulatory-like domain-containing protein [Gemmatimonadetes bacterium]|nr:carboxypeptidase regulatory-like domain-containing protein [Gemmatimonadota bacterium]